MRHKASIKQGTQLFTLGSLTLGHAGTQLLESAVGTLWWCSAHGRPIGHPVSLEAHFTHAFMVKCSLPLGS